MFPISVGNPPVVTGVFKAGAGSNSNSTVYTFTNLVPALAASKRYVAAVTIYDNNVSINSVTLRSEACTQRRNIQTTFIGAYQRAWIGDVLLAAGSVGNAVVSLSGNLGIAGTCAISLYELDATATYRTGVNAERTDSGTPLNSSVAANVGEYAIAAGVASFGSNVDVLSWNFVTERFEFDGSNSEHGSASFAITATGTQSCSLGSLNHEMLTTAMAIYQA